MVIIVIIDPKPEWFLGGGFVFSVEGDFAIPVRIHRYLHREEVFSPAPLKVACACAISPLSRRGARAAAEWRRLQGLDHEQDSIVARA